MHKFFHHCQLIQSGSKEVPGELIKYLKVNEQQLSVKGLLLIDVFLLPHFDGEGGQTSTLRYFWWCILKRTLSVMYFSTK